MNLRVPLPVGLDYDEDGQVVLDADEEVRTAVGDVFAAFAGRTFPLRAYGGVWDGHLRWGKLTHGRVLGVLTNPAYAGTYVYGRHRTQRTVQPDGTVRTTNPRVPRADWRIVLHDHHDGYITWQRFLDIEAKLTANCTHQGARPPREGEHLCQGIIGCGCRFGTRYQGKHHLAQYDCMGHRDAARTPAAAIELITRLGPVLTDEELVTELAAARLTTGKRRPFDVKAVRWARHAHRILAPRTVPFHDGRSGSTTSPATWP